MNTPARLPTVPPCAPRSSSPLPWSPRWRRYGVARTTPYWFAPRQTAQVDIHDPALITQGQYLSRAADCAACHTAPGGKPFAGGLGMQTPMGTIYSTNITPDPDTGIGAYDYADFERAVRRGIRHDGQPPYPAMPYASYVIASVPRSRRCTPTSWARCNR